jgi:hypothetical protein
MDCPVFKENDSCTWVFKRLKHIGVLWNIKIRAPLSSDMKRGKILSISFSRIKVRYPLLSKVTKVPWDTSRTLRARKMRCCSQTLEMIYRQFPRRTDVSSTTLRKPKNSLKGFQLNRLKILPKCSFDFTSPLVWVLQPSSNSSANSDTRMVDGGCLKADSHIACRAHAVPLPCRAAKGLECVFPISFAQCCRVWFTLAMPCPCHAPNMPFFSRPRHRTSVEIRPVGYVPAFGFFRLPRWVPRRLLSEAYQSSSQRSIPTTVKEW